MLYYVNISKQRVISGVEIESGEFSLFSLG